MNINSLKTALGDCKNIHKSTCTNQSSYIETNRELFFVWGIDSEEPVILLTEKGEAQLSVINNAGKEICLIKTDACLFDKSHQKCDCVLFDSSKVYFVEIKSVKTKLRGPNRKIAVNQLAKTIEVFRENNVVMNSHQLFAVICFKSGTTKPTSASLNSMRATFLDQHNVMLEEGNEITF